MTKATDIEHDDELDATSEPGSWIAGKYCVECVLGTGGMGVVVAARQEPLGRLVAIKMMSHETAAVREARERFLREARAVVDIQSEHVVRVMEVSELDGVRPFMVMEYLSGRDLAEALEQGGPLSVEQAIGYVLQACEALAEAHGLGIIHRDLKPSNLFATERPDGSTLIKLLDFGISRASAGGPALDVGRLTASRTVMGTPEYMSPEQLRSAKNADERSDIWALGSTVYELLTTRPPFEAESLSGLCAAIAADEPVALRQRREDLPVELEQVVMRCLEKDPDRRYQNVAELARALGPFASPEAQASVARVSKIVEAESRSASVPPVARVADSSIPPGRAEERATTTLVRPSRTEERPATTLVLPSDDESVGLSPTIAKTALDTPQRLGVQRRSTKWIAAVLGALVMGVVVAVVVVLSGSSNEPERDRVDGSSTALSGSQTASPEPDRQTASQTSSAPLRASGDPAATSRQAASAEPGSASTATALPTAHTTSPRRPLGAPPAGNAATASTTPATTSSEVVRDPLGDRK